MTRKPSFSKALLALTVAGLLLPMMIVVVMGLAALLAAMGDSLGGAVLRYVALAGGAAWIVVLAAIVFVQAIQALGQPDDGDQ